MERNEAIQNSKATDFCFVLRGTKKTEINPAKNNIQKTRNSFHMGLKDIENNCMPDLRSTPEAYLLAYSTVQNQNLSKAPLKNNSKTVNKYGMNTPAE